MSSFGRIILVLISGLSAQVALAQPWVADPLSGVTAIEAPIGAQKIDIRAELEPPTCPPGAPSVCGQSCGTSRGLIDGVHLFSGEAFVEAQDMRIRGRGLDFVWARTYRSRVPTASAMGQGWDFSYNISIQRIRSRIIVRDGHARRDVYRRQADGTWAADEFFQELARNPDGTYTLTFQDLGQWHFHALDGSPAAGKIASSADRNGNSLSFSYDNAGRLTAVIDTLDRAITIAYNADGYIESVSDFTGREVRYAYYQDGDADGSPGDLKSARSPIVVGTPTGNDFPEGKTTVYTYSTGFDDERLNHNLLTITDPKEQTFLRCTYGATLDPAHPLFDRLAHRELGDPGDNTHFAYFVEEPTPDNNFATKLTIVNDAVGNVGEYCYDDLNRMVMVREFTGRANPDQVTTKTANRPQNKLRPAHDPDFFETRYEYNEDSKITRILYPELNETLNVYELDLDPGAARRARGNLREVHRLPGPRGGDQIEIIEFFEYDTAFGGCCGSNFVTRHVDGRGNETLHMYDERGNRIHTQHRIPSIVEDREYNEFGQVTAHILPANGELGSGHRRRDEFTYYNSGDMTGYLKDRIVDATGLRLTTTYEYNPRGHVAKVSDPKRQETDLVRNDLDQVVQRLAREVLPGTVRWRYERLYYYDANDNRVREDVQNVDAAGVLQANEYLTTVRDLEILNRVVRECREKGSHDVSRDPLQLNCDGLPETGQFITVEYEFDANRNRTLVRSGEAVNGNDPDNVVETLHDERDLIFRIIQAPGHADHSTDQRDYDHNGNLVILHEGLEEDPPQITTYERDGYNRRVRNVGPMGNVLSIRFDENSNVVSTRLDGELIDVAGGAGNVRLAETSVDYDLMDRQTRIARAFFHPATQTPIDDGLSETFITWSDVSLPLEIADDNGHVDASLGYDTANRPQTVSDPLGNTRTLAFDANSNVVSVVELDRSDLGQGDQEFTTTRGFDELDRLIRTIDNVGNVAQRQLDSRGNVGKTIDQRGNRIIFTFDSVDRALMTTRLMTDTGAGGGAVIGQIETSQVWNDNNRVTARSDGNGNPTTYVYDALNRLTVTDYADCTSLTRTFDVHDNVVRTIDGNGTEVDYAYYLNDRVTSKTVSVFGEGVSHDTTFENYVYDGRGLSVSAQDDDALVTLAWDSLGNCDSETLNGQTTQRTFDGVGNELTCSYPGSRTISQQFDVIDRVTTILDGENTSADFSYVGPLVNRGTAVGNPGNVTARIERIGYANGTRVDLTWDGITGVPSEPGDFGVKRISGTTHTLGGVPFDDRAYKWDPAGNKKVRDNLLSGVRFDHHYDSISRLVRTVRTPPGPPPGEIVYVLDDAGNRVEVMGGPDPGDYVMDDTLCYPGDGQMNQYTTTPFDALRQYDDNGNMLLRDGPFEDGLLVFDYASRLVQYENTGTGVVANYKYDCFGRRIEKLVVSPGPGPMTTITRFFYTGANVIEEQDELGATLATYAGFCEDNDEPGGIWAGSSFVGNLPGDQFGGTSGATPCCAMQRDGADYFYHRNDIGNVVGLTDAAGQIVERYAYRDYGETLIFDAQGEPIPVSAVGNPYTYKSMRLDDESHLHFSEQAADADTEYLDSRAGRFVSRGAFDDHGPWWGANLGNAFTAFANNPWSTAGFGDGWAPWPHGITNLPWNNGTWLTSGAEHQAVSAFQGPWWEQNPWRLTGAPGAGITNLPWGSGTSGWLTAAVTAGLWDNDLDAVLTEYDIDISASWGEDVECDRITESWPCSCITTGGCAAVLSKRPGDWKRFRFGGGWR